MTEQQFYDAQCAATGETLLSVEAPDEYTAMQRVRIALSTLPRLPDDVLVYEHPPEVPLTAATYRDGYFQMLAQRSASH